MASGAYTPEALRALDGPALTRVAWEIGLAPEGADLWPDSDMVYAFFQRQAWEPHANLAQADAVFRQLRARGWTTINRYDAAYRAGEILAILDPERFVSTMYRTPATTATEVSLPTDTEPLALLRCAVLAVASAPQEAPHA